MTQHDWDQLCFNVRDKMTPHVWRYSTPISKVIDDTHGKAHGTGYYLRLNSALRLLTNEHVAREIQTRRLAHLPVPDSNFVAFPNPFYCAEWPLDIAITRLGDECASMTREAIVIDQIDERYAPMKGELLFWIGYPGSNAERNEVITENKARKTMFGWLQSEAFPMLSQEFQGDIPFLKGFDPEYHIAVCYPSMARSHAASVPTALRNPSGMSGSLLWDTKALVAVSKGKKWSPDQARVCGIMWATFEKPEILIATKIEFARSKLLEMLRGESAYFHWLDGGCPLWDALDDWAYAESELPKLA